MKKILFTLLFLPSILLSGSFPQTSIIKVQAYLKSNSFSTSIWNTGIFNQNVNFENSPSLQWHDNSGKFLGLSAGLCIGAYFNGELRLANATYKGEFSPGYIINSSVPYAKTSESFHLYKVSKGDNASNNPDYMYWYLMTELGAPYNDVNNNGIYDIGIDSPGVKNAAQTIFVCLTDGFLANHSISEGFSGGTAPLFADIHLTAWVYDIPGYEDIQFIKYVVLNKSLVEWKKTYFSMFMNPQIGDSLDDYVGCDTIRRLGYAYNKDNNDGTGQGNSYGAAPPAVGIKLLDQNDGLSMTSFHYVIPEQIEPSPPCEEFPYTPLEAYNLMRGYKKDNTPWLDPTASPPKATKFTFPGDPETGSGWTEYTGVIDNCFGSTSGQVTPNYSNRRTFLMSSGSDSYSVPCPSYIQFQYAQLVARGTDNKNSVTKLKLLADKAQNFYEHGFIIGITPVSTEIPDKFSLFQNYPNPFNPSTKIKFEIAKSDFVNLTVFDLSGKIVEELVNEKLNEGVYEVNFTAKNISSGIYFYRLSTDNFTQTNRMILVK
ncbi:MAG: T9SS type A sorting domain-containing protein [Bacteroidetes bacterium]|nr:T9SS type A sorting domain-containing protein [Bacteroidota bacterium]